MSAPGGLSLAAVGELVGRVASAQPDVLSGTVTGFGDLATRTAEATLFAEQVDRATAEGFVSAGREVYDAQAASSATRARLGDGGEQYRLVADSVRIVAEELTGTKRDVTREWEQLLAVVEVIRSEETALAEAAPSMTQPEVDAQAARLRERYTSAVDQHGGVISRLVEGYRDVLINRSQVLEEILGAVPTALPAATGPGAAPPPGASPAEVNAWWRGLDPQQQADLIATDPGLVGNLYGVPIAARDQANRAELAAEILRYEGLQRDAQTAVDRGVAAESSDPLLDDLPPSPVLLEAQAELAAATARLDGLRAIQARLDDPALPPASLVAFAPEVGNGRAAVAVGDPDTADNVLTYVPGAVTGLDTLAGDLDRGDRMAAAAARVSPESTAVVTWLGYDSPPTLANAFDPSYADAGEPALRTFQEGLRAAHEGPPSHNTVLGYSYGSTVVGHTARDGSLDADTVVLVGSIGTGVDRVDELGRPPGSVYATTAEADPAGQWYNPSNAVHGTDPSDRSFGAEIFRSDPASGHSDYWRARNPSLDSFGLIATGQEPIR